MKHFFDELLYLRRAKLFRAADVGEARLRAQERVNSARDCCSVLHGRGGGATLPTNHRRRARLYAIT